MYFDRWVPVFHKILPPTSSAAPIQWPKSVFSSLYPYSSFTDDLLFYPDDKGMRLIKNNGTHLPNYTV
jgi:hypothetical protein